MNQSIQHLPAVIQAIAPLVDQYGYFAVFGLLLVEDFGVPAPGETVLIAAAFFAGFGHLNIFLVILAGLLGAIIGDNIGFAIGRYGGHPVVERYGKYVFLTKKRLEKLEVFFNRHGPKIIVVARFIEGLRQLNGIIAGLSEMKWRQFVTFNIIGATIWVVFWSMVGYYSGSHIETYLRYQLYFTVFALLTVASLIMFKVFKRKREQQAG